MQKRILFILALIILKSPAIVMAQNDNVLPEIKFPEITDYTPKTKKGWVGQYVYELHFNDSTSYGTGKKLIKYRIKGDNIHTGFIEFPMEVRGSIRTNQPDKNNTTRWESWIQSGTSKSWSKVNDTITAIAPVGNMVNDAITGRLETNTAFNSGDTWVKGWMNNADLQIDHTEKKYTLAVPLLSFYIEVNEWGAEFTYSPAGNKPFSKKQTKELGLNCMIYPQPVEWSMITDTFDTGQKEIVVRKRIPVKLAQFTTQGTKDIPLPVKKGYMDFYMVLKRIG